MTFGLRGWSPEHPASIAAVPASGRAASLIFFIYTQSVRDLFMAQVSTHALLGAYVVVCWAYLGLKQLLYLFVNWVFFDKERRTAWMKSYSFLVSSESVLLFPLALIAVFFNLPVHEVMLCSCLLVGFVRILLFYKTFCIFFPKIPPKPSSWKPRLPTASTGVP